MTNYVEQDVKQSKIQELADLSGQVSRALEKANLGIDISEYEKQLISNDYPSWVRIQSMLKDFEISEDIYEDFLQFPSHYKTSDNEIIYNENWEVEAIQKEKERIATLSLTAADVERALYKAFGKDFDDVLSIVQELNPEGVDLKALRIELKANNFFRGNPYVSIIGRLLGITDEQLDEFFETNDYTKLLINR